MAHGQAVALMLPHVIRFNGQLPECAAWYRELWRMQEDAPAVSIGEAPDRLAEHVQRLAAEAGLATRLRDCGVIHNALPELATAAAQQWTGGFNPRPTTAHELQHLYEMAF